MENICARQFSAQLKKQKKRISSLLTGGVVLILLVRLASYNKVSLERDKLRQQIPIY